MKLTKNLFEFVITTQIIVFVVFLIENINTMDNVTIELELMGETSEFTLNLYGLLGIIAFVFVIALIGSVSIFGLGLNSEGTRTIVKYLAYVLIYILSSISFSYYLGALGEFYGFLEILFILIYLLNIIGSSMEK